jgi:hypothetical protein
MVEVENTPKAIGLFMSSEQEIHIAICKYIKLQYPKVLFTSESSGLRVTMNQARKLKSMRSCAGLPDIMIFEPRKNYYGLFLEVKRDGTKVYKKDGDIRQDKHLQEQEEILHQLKQRGYFAEFVVGFDEAKSIIDFYFS